MILSFKSQFILPIIKGTKIHTVREDPNHRWEAGRKTHMATGVRTKFYNCFREDECTGVQDVVMTLDHDGNLPRSAEAVSRISESARARQIEQSKKSIESTETTGNFSVKRMALPQMRPMRWHHR